MKIVFANKALETLLLKDDYRYPHEVVKKYRLRVSFLQQHTTTIATICNMRSLRFERLHQKYDGCYSIRINKQRRVIFRRYKETIHFLEITELSKHYE